VRHYDRRASDIEHTVEQRTLCKQLCHTGDSVDRSDRTALEYSLQQRHVAGIEDVTPDEVNIAVEMDLKACVIPYGVTIPNLFWLSTLSESGVG